MKKIFVIFVLLSLALFVPPKNISAYQQTEAVCYSQCAAYKFYWKGDFCWDLFMNQCSVSSKDMVKNAISLVKDTAKAMATGKLMTIVDVSEVFKAMFVCKPLIEDCIVPQLNACENTCKNISQTFYAPNLSVGNPYGSTAYHNVYYDEDDHQLVFKVINDGGYAWDIDVSASWGHTRNRDKIVGGGGTLFTERIPELLFFGARVGSPKTPGDYVTDFLIDESNFSGFLSRFKSDADNHYIPPAWYKTVPFTAPDGEYTKVILNVDPNQMIPESSEGDNTYILEIDKLPTPVSLSVEKLTFRRTNPTSLTEYMVSFELKNSGEESGNAHVKWYEGNYVSGKNPIHEQNMVIQGLNKALFDHILNVDVSNGGDSCNYSQKYTLVVFDDEGFIKARQEFSIPRFAGSIHGRVEDLFGKKVVGATITTSTGQTTTVNDMGYYHIGGIPTLGKITVTATHPDFSKTETKEVEIKFDDSKDKCHIEGLTLNGVNFVLKDQDVMFTVTVKDQSGNPVTARVLASNPDWRFDQAVVGTVPLPGMQPGEYVFTLSAPGYKTISQTVNAVPNDQNLEFTLEKLNGRPTDGGLSIHEPRLLWQWERGTEIVSQITATKDGKEVLIYTTANRSNTGKLYFLETMTGKQIKVVSPTLATGGQAQVCLDTSYDGNTTALYVHDGTFGMAQDTRNVLKLFNNQGNEFGTKDWESGGGVSSCDVSPDGFYIYPERLINKGLYQYTRHDIEGIENSQERISYSSSNAFHFTTANNLVAGCPKDSGQCVQSIYRNVVANLGLTRDMLVKIDSSQDSNKIAAVGIDKAFLFSGSGKLWEKEVKMHGDPLDISVSPGGEYVIYSTVSKTDHGRIIKIFTDNNLDKTPANTTNPGRTDVIFVHANDKGLFFAIAEQRTIKYYQVGSYATEYKPETVSPSPAPLLTNNISVYENGSWDSLNQVNYYSLLPGKIYLATKTVDFNLMEPYGSLHILKDTLFGVDQNHHPVLLKGQMTANFTSPALVYAIKFDRFDMTLFQTKLDQLIAGTLPSGEYFVVKNIHTKFTLKNQPNSFNVSVDNGQISVLADKTEKIVDSGKQISIDASNNIKESIYIGFKIYVIIIGILILILSVVLFIYRKSKVGSKIIEILKKIGQWTLKIIKTVVIWSWEMAKKITPILWKGIRLSSQFLVKTVKKNTKK